MATKSLTITEEAYERLRNHKRPDESFTDTILRLTGNERDLMKGFGLTRETTGFRETVESSRDELDTDIRNRTSK